ncbi:MAG: hypothetical protein R6V67_06040 [Spirochaetia bacterium]
MSFKLKLALLLGCILLLLAVYLTGERFSSTEETRETPSPLFSKEELSHLEKIEIPRTNTLLIKKKGNWFLSGVKDSSLYRVDEKAIEAFIHELEDADIFADYPLESEEWIEYSDSGDVEMSLSTQEGQNARYTTALRLGDEVSGTARRYATKGEGRVYEAEDLLETVGSTHENWAELSLFNLDFTHTNLIALEIIIEGEKALGEIEIPGLIGENRETAKIRLERRSLEGVKDNWLIIIEEGQSKNTTRPKTEDVERLTDTLMRIKGEEYLGRKDSEKVKSFLKDVVIHISMERGDTRTETVEIAKTKRGYAGFSLADPSESAVFSIPEGTVKRIFHGITQLFE